MDEAVTSVDIGRRAAGRAEKRMLIDGALVSAVSGAEFGNLSPATGLVLGTTAAAGAQDMDRAIGAARRAFDETGWSTDRGLRQRVLAQLQEAIESEKADLREELIAEVGCPAMTTENAQLDWPLADALRYPARLIDEFEWERTLDGGGLFGERNARTVVKEAVGVVAAITPFELPDRGDPQQARAGAGSRQHRGAQTRSEHAVERHPAGPVDRRAYRYAARRGQRRPDAVE